MKKLLAILLLTTSVSAIAQHGYGFRPHPYYGGVYGNNWVGPALIGGVIGYELSRPRYYEQPVIVQQPVYTITPQPSCTVWTETQQPDGTITRTRTCSQ